MLMDIIKARHSIRKFTHEQISREDLELIMEAGNYAPNAGGSQRSWVLHPALSRGAKRPS